MPRIGFNTAINAELNVGIRQSDLRIAICAFNKHIATELTSRLAGDRTLLDGSDEQKAIWDVALNGEANIIVAAVAGSGKSTTALQYCYRAGGTVAAMTYHSLGFRAVKKAVRGQCDVDQYKVDGIIDGITLPCAQGQEFVVKGKLKKLVSLAKQYGLKDRVGLEWIVDAHDLDMNGHEDLVLDYTPKILDKCAKQTSTVDFDDMVWLPCELQLDMPQYDLVITDECFIGDTPIMIDSKSTRTIRSLVESKYSGTVASYSNGKTVFKHVTDWHKIPVKGNLVRITTRRISYCIDGSRMQDITSYVRYGNRYAVCTEDHKFLNGAGAWVKAGNLRIGDRLIQESHAPKVKAFTHKYKHGLAGRANLSGLMAQKNKDGKCGQAVKNGRINTRGGNGHIAPSEEALRLRLGPEWQSQYAIHTKLWKKGGRLPTAYKVDFANVTDKIALEIDGASHNSLARKTQDAKKDQFLRALGWTVVRLKNREVLALTDEMLQERISNSPVECEVIAIEKYEPREPFVYDITVEDTHCYYANGVLAHNCQDLNVIQQWCALRSSDRHIVLGDKNQSIYSFRGADSKSMERMKAELAKSKRGVVELPLNFTRRCPTSHVLLAQTIVPNIKAMPDAPKGVVRHETYEKALGQMKVGDLVLCRVNADLLSCAYQLIRCGTKAVIRGRDIGQGIVQLIAKCEKKGKGTLEVARMLKLAWEVIGREIQKYNLMPNGRGAMRSQAAQDKYDCLCEVAGEAKDSKEVKGRVESLFSDFEADGTPKNAVILGTIHRTKGLESNRVWILRPELIPHPMARREEEKAQEYHIAYIAVTRSMGELVFVEKQCPLFPMEV